MKIENALANPAQHLMIYGNPFTGKSTLAASVALLGHRIIWVSLDRSIVHLQKLPAEAQERVELIHLPDTRDNPCAYSTVMSMFKRGAPAFHICNLHGIKNCGICLKQELPTTIYHYDKLGPETIIVLDHITQVAESAMTLIIKKAIRNGDKDATGETWKENDPDAVLLFKPAYAQWQHIWNFMSELGNKIQASPVNVVAISHAVESKDDSNKSTGKITPHAGSDRFSQTWPRYFDHVIYADVIRGEHKFHSSTASASGFYAGSRTDINLSTEGGTPSLAPFFGEISPAPREYGAEAAAGFLSFEEEVTKGMPSLDTPGISIGNTDVAARLAALKKKGKI